MKQKTNLLARAATVLLLAVLSSAGAWGATDVITIGTAQSTTNQLPTNQYYNYGLSQQIYTSSEIGHAAGFISSIGFNTGNGPSTRNLTIYLAHTTKESFDNNKDFVAVTDADIVFSGDATFVNGQWNTIDLDSPFSYDGTSNIIVTVNDKTGSYASSDGFKNYVFDATAQAVYVYSDDTNFDPTALSYPSYSKPVLYDSKNQIQFSFETHPKPSNANVSDVGDVSAQIACTLLGAEAWNLRYRKVTAEGEEEQRWVAYNDLKVRSYTIEDLTPATKYEAQVQAVYAAEEEGGEDILSAWTKSLVFTTNCCPVEEQVEIMYALNSHYIEWFDYAVQIVDVTDKTNPVEVAYLRAPSSKAYGGTVTLCCNHEYQVNWIYDENYPVYSQSYNFSLYYNTGDLIYSMARGEAPEETAELTTFVMDCTPYCTQMPQILNESGTTYNSATITFLSQTKTGQVVYSTEADFDPEKATPEDMDFEEVSQSEVPWDQPNASITLKGLQPLTAYYVRVRSVCTTEPIGVSRWSDPVKVTTGSRYDAPTQVIAEPVNSRTEKLSWSRRGNEKSHNLYYRKQAAGNPVDPSDIQTFGGGNGTGFEDGNWGEGIQSSYGDHPFSNMLFVEGIPAGSSFSFKAGNGKTGAGQTKFFYGKRKKDKDKKAHKTMESLDMSCLNDADRAARKKQYELLIWALEEQIKLAKEKLDEGTITQEQYDKEVAESTQKIDKYRENLEMLNALPTDAQKLETMKALEASLASEGLSQEERQSKLAELNELRAITTNAENPQKDGFSITKEKESANARTRGTDDDTYIFFIRHNDPNGVLLVKDLTITPPELQGEWTVIPNVSGNSYMLTGLEPGTAYEVMVEPVYDDGTTGMQSPITVFTTLGKETDPSEGMFSVSKGKQVQFAKGNLRYSGDIEGYEYEWSMAEQQYEVLGQANIKEQGSNTSPANLHDLFCWSTTKNYCGVYSYYYDDDVDVRFKGDFVDWGTDAKLASNLGEGWSTLTKDEWSYLLTEREDAAAKKAIATISIDDKNKVKGLLLLPDEWTAPDGAPAIDGSAVELTLAQWEALEKAGAVFLPAAGQMTATYDSNSWNTNTTLTEAGTYWTSTPSGDKSDLNAIVLTIGDESATVEGDLYRRVYTAVRLVKALPEPVKGDANNDGVVNAVDVVYVVAFCKDGTKLPNFSEKAADADGNGTVDANDIQAIKEIIMTP